MPPSCTPPARRSRLAAPSAPPAPTWSPPWSTARTAACSSGALLFRGKVSDVQRRTTEGHLWGELRVSGLGDWRGQEFHLSFQNEFSVGWLDGAVRITLPDLIRVLDADSGEAIGTETVRFSQRVAVIALPAPEIRLSEKGLAHVGPRAFGLDLDFISLFDGPVG